MNTPAFSRRTHMGYMNEFEQELRQRLAQDDVEAVVTWVKEKLLESYRNGQRDGAPPPTQGQRYERRPRRFPRRES